MTWYHLTRPLLAFSLFPEHTKLVCFASGAQGTLHSLPSWPQIKCPPPPGSPTPQAHLSCSEPSTQ